MRYDFYGNEKVDEVVFDLTSEQYGEQAKDLVYDRRIDEVQERETPGHFGKEEKTPAIRIFERESKPLLPSELEKCLDE